MKKYFQLILVMILFTLFITNSSFVSHPIQNNTLDKSQISDLLISNMSSLANLQNNCIGCHLDGELMGLPTVNLVHQPTSVNHRMAIIGFVNTHNNVQAAEKRVDLDKVVLYVASLSY